MLQEDHSVSCVIRTRDTESRLKELLWKLSLQSLPLSELVVVDNFSSKEKLREMIDFLSAAKKFFNGKIRMKLAPIVDEEFSHAYSTNVGVCLATADLVCITNGHSLPFSDVWLESGVAHFRNPETAGVGGYATSHEDGTIWEKLAYGYLWKEFNEKSRAYARDNYFSTMNCILRKRLWKEYPFDEKLPSKIPLAREFGGEDYDWAREMIARRYRIIVEPRFCVYHSHREGLSNLASKYFAWQKIRKWVGSLERPRKSYTRLGIIKPQFFNL